MSLQDFKELGIKLSKDQWLKIIDVLTERDEDPEVAKLVRKIRGEVSKAINGGENGK